jgi:guanylate kinase
MTAHAISRGNLFIVIAPSGAGKTSLVRALLARDPGIQKSISYTTRPPRPGETDGVDYHFVSAQKFEQMLEEGDFLESAEVYGHRYGTSQLWLERTMQTGVDILLEIDWQGAIQVRKLLPHAVSIFILPPSIEALVERLKSRGQDAPDVIAKRVQAAREDISHVVESDYVIINAVFDEALQDMLAVVRSQRLKMAAQLQRWHDTTSNMK